VILLVTFILSLLLTFVQVATGNDTLALLFPWRMSAILVPIATVVILTRFVHSLADKLPSPSLWGKRAVRATYGTALAVFVAGGVAINYFDLGYHENNQEIALLKYIHERKAPGDTYLLPVEIPKLGARGAASRNFTPPPQRSKQDQIISIDLQRFRLFTGAPIYVDFKSIPYKDIEVLEWHTRIEWNHKLYKERDWDQREIEAELARRRITHVIAATDRDIRCDALEFVREVEGYRVYRVRAEIVAAGRERR
jgi:hypothetical protein